MSNWTGQDYLNASLEDILDRANTAQNESEIPFVSAVLEAKANRDQKKAATRSLITAAASVIVAVLALFNSFYMQSKNDIQKTEFIRQVESLDQEIVNLRERVSDLEKQIVSIEVKTSKLDTEQARMGSIIHSAITTIPIHSHENIPSSTESSESK